MAVITYMWEGRICRNHAAPALLNVVADDLDAKNVPYILESPDKGSEDIEQ